MLVQPERSAVTVVVIGQYLPIVFSPLWLSSHDLIGEEQAKAASVEIIHSNLTRFEFGWGALVVTKTELVVESSEAPWVRVSDFVSRLLSECIPDTPVTMMGINRVVDFRAASSEKRHEAGRLIAPTAPWGNWGKRLEEGKGEKVAGLQTLTMRLPTTERRLSGFIDVEVAPSPLEKLRADGIRVAINDHYDFTSAKSEALTRAVAVLREHFERSIEQSESIVDDIMAISR